MTATSVLLILIGLFVIINSQNLVGVFQGNKSFSFQGSKSKTVPASKATTREAIQKDLSTHRSVSDTGY